MKSAFFLLMIVLSALITNAQTATATNPNQVADSLNNKIFTTVDISPEYPGGLSELAKFLRKNLKYRGGEEGRVRISFVVDKDGSLTDIKIVTGLSAAADAEVLRVIKLSPKWTPGTQDGRAVRVQYTTAIPIPFNN